jgi:hypothetical protein
MAVRLTAELDSDVEDLNRWAINGLTVDSLMTIHEALEVTMKTLVDQINEAHFFNGKTYRAITVYNDDTLLKPNKLLKPPFASDPNAAYNCTEDILFLSEELRKVSEIMFRIKTEPGVM